jgi:hypothetical protein
VSYLLNPDGSSSLFEYPGAANTFAAGINHLGVIAGFYRSGGQGHGFLRNPDGSFIAFDVPGLFSVNDINDLGDIVGSAGHQAFVRHPDGSVVFFEVPGQTASPRFIRNPSVLPRPH